LTFERDSADKRSAGNAPIRLSAWILPAPDDRVRLLVGELCLDVAIESVLRIDPAAPSGPAEAPLAADVELAPRAQVLTVGPAAVWREFFRAGPRPFALAARRAKVTVEGHGAYLEREIAYLRDHGLDRSSDRDQR
jgi:hypothetical protein